MKGRSIRLFLVDGVATGIRTAELGNWTGMALVSPRSEFHRFKERAELARTGVYFLLGTPEESGVVPVYVGEGDEVWPRLAAHNKEKDWWTWCVVFVSKDDNLTKSHVRWLESKLASSIARARRADLKNGNQPKGGRLPEADEADMKTFLSNILLLLPTLGADIFAKEMQSTTKQGEEALPRSQLVLEMTSKNANAFCVVKEGQYIIQKSSTALIQDGASLADSLRARRTKLREMGVLAVKEDDDSLLYFTQNYAFDSPSTAAAIVAAISVNGRVAWKIRGKNISYKDWQANLDDGANENSPLVTAPGKI